MPTVQAPRAQHRVVPASFRRILGPLDGSAHAESALGPAAALGRLFGAPLRLIGVGLEEDQATELADRLAPLAGDADATWETRVDWDVPSALTGAAAEESGTLLCLASHGRGGMRRAVLGSVAGGVLAEAEAPVVLIGPACDPERSPTSGPVMACVDGSSASEQILPVAASWALALGAPLNIVTVADPDAPGDPWAYVMRLADRWRGPGLEVGPVALFNAYGPAEGLAEHLRGNPAGLIALNTHGRSGVARAVLGSQATAVLRLSPVPVLAIRRDAAA